MDQDIAGNRGHRGCIRDGVLEVGIVFLEMGLQLALRSSCLHNGITVLFTHLKNLIHSLHIKHNSSLQRNGQP